MTLGELNFFDEYFKDGNQSFYIDNYIVFLLFFFIVSISMMNLMVSFYYFSYLGSLYIHVFISN